MSGLRPVAAFFIVFATIAWIMVALSVAKTATLPSETQYSQNSQTVPEATAPLAGGGSLSGKLNRSQGVIHPPRGVDQGMAQSPPRSGSSTPVIPPPGTDGNRPEVHPK